MKKFFGILAIALVFSTSTYAQNAAGSGSGTVSQPSPMIDSVAFVGTTPFGAYNYNSYPVTNGGKDTVRFARQLWLGTRVSQTYPIASIHITIHKDSTGTINAAKAYLEASDDGINWVRQLDTLSCTNITTNFHDWVLPNPTAQGVTGTGNYVNYKYAYLPYLYYRVLFVGVSTSKADVKAYFVGRR